MVFISYSHDSDAVCDSVLELANYLRSCGVDAIIDQYEESPLEGWPRWMESQIRSAEFVLVVSTPNYQEKATLRVHSDTGLGVKWETNLILNQLYSTGATTNKFTPVVLTDSDVQSILVPLQGQTYYNVSHLPRRDALRNRLLGIKETKKPPLGSFVPKEKKQPKSDARMLVTGVVNRDLWNKAGWKGSGYLFNHRDIPCFGLQFKNESVGRKIFSEWRARFGTVDLRDEIYISLIEEVESEDYHVHIGANFQAIVDRLRDQGLDGVFNLFTIIDRWHRMEIVDRKYLNEFKKEVARCGEFIFLPIELRNGKLHPVLELGITKKLIRFRKITEVKSDKTDYDGAVHIGVDNND